MKALFAALFTVTLACSAQAQLVLKAGADGTVYEPNPVRMTSPVLTTPVLSGTLTGTYTLGGTPTLTSPSLTTPAITGAVTGTFSLPATATVPSATITQTQTSYTADGAISLTPGTKLIAKAASEAAMTIAAPGVAGIRITFTTTTDFAHVVTFTGGTLWDGTAGANTTWTSAAVQGSSLTVESVSATKWNAISFNLGTIAP